MTKLHVIFDIIQGHQITDRELYYTEGEIPVFTGNNEVKGYWDKGIVNKDQLPCLTYPTKANTGVLFVQEKIFDANNTAVLIPKEGWRDKIDLHWFKFKLSTIFLDIMTSKGGVSYLNKEIVRDIDVHVPNLKKQLSEVRYFLELEKMKFNLEDALNKVNSLLSKNIV